MLTGEPATRRSRRPSAGWRASCIRTSTSTTLEAEEKFKEAAEAYEVLSDPDRRSTYDAFGHDGLRSGGWAPHSDAFGSFEDVLSAFFGRGDPLFSELFGFGRAGPASGGDVAAQVEVSLEEVLTGASREVSFEAVSTCERCRGNAAEPGTPIRACETCGGSGELREVARVAFGQVVRTGACPTCGGQGRVPETPCEECGGEGRTARARTWEVEVPPGIESGQRIRISGAGHAGETGGRSGDLYVQVVVADDERFERHGQDLVTVVELPATRAMLGTAVTVPTLDGEREIEVPAGAQPGEQIVAAGPGPAIPSWRGARRPARGAGRLRARRPEQGPARAGRAARRGPGARELARRRRRLALAPPRSRQARQVIRLAVRCRPELAERVLADLVELAPEGVEEERGDGYVEYAIYGAPGELPALPDLEAIAGDGLVAVTSAEIPDDWADRWQDFHRPLDVGGRLWVRPSWEAPREGTIDIVVDPGQAFGTGAHPTTRMCLELLLELADAGHARGALADWGTGSGVLAIAAAKLGFGPIVACDHEPAALEAAGANARANGVELELRRANLRRQPPPPAPTVVANLTAPILREISRRLERAPERLICSGLLAGGGRGRTGRLRHARPERAAEPVRGRLGRNLLRGGVDRLTPGGGTIRA